MARINITTDTLAFLEQINRLSLCIEEDSWWKTGTLKDLIGKWGETARTLLAEQAIAEMEALAPKHPGHEHAERVLSNWETLYKKQTETSYIKTIAAREDAGKFEVLTEQHHEPSTPASRFAAAQAIGLDPCMVELERERAGLAGNGQTALPLEPTPTRQTCGICDQPGHNRKTCTVPPSETTKIPRKRKPRRVRTSRKRRGEDVTEFKYRSEEYRTLARKCGVGTAGRCAGALVVWLTEEEIGTVRTALVKLNGDRSSRRDRSHAAATPWQAGKAIAAARKAETETEGGA